MARIPKEQPSKEPRKHIIKVPLIQIKPMPDSDSDNLYCDKCGEIPDDQDKAMFCIGVAENSTLVLAHFCKPCFAELEWGQVYAPGRGFGTPCIPIGMS